jgi:DNA-directed RNA polymerase subunit N (RpoN/RPB10)
MEYYKEYSIRCKSCNEQIACFVPDFESLKSTGMTEEEALNEIGITETCSRIAFIHPTYVFHNMENRELIEGFKTVDNIETSNPNNSSFLQPYFNPCLDDSKININEKIEENTTFSLVKSLKSKIKPLIENRELVEDKNETFKYPTLVGFSEINYNPLIGDEFMDVGSMKKSKIINGRTYYAI